MFDEKIMNKLANMQAANEALNNADTLEEAVEWYAEEYSYDIETARHQLWETLSDVIKII